MRKFVGLAGNKADRYIEKRNDSSVKSPIQVMKMNVSTSILIWLAFNLL